MKPAATTNPSLSEQFQNVLRLQSEGRWTELMTLSDGLLELGLKPEQRALIMQAQAEASLSEGNQHKAAWLMEQSLQWMFTPDTAVHWLEITLPEWAWQEARQEDVPWAPAWVPVCQQLVRSGHGDLLVATLHGVLTELPLEGQRQELIDAIERWQALLLDQHLTLERQWQWLRILTTGRASLET